MNTTNDPRTLAQEGLCVYSGDVHPISHDGFWYQPKTWETDGYASCVEVCVLPDGPANARHIVVSRLTINKPNPQELARAFDCYGIPPGPDRDNTNAQIEACKGYMGGEPDESDWREASSQQFILPDDTSESPGHFTRYAKIHGATIATESDVWKLLEKWVGRELA